MFDHLFPSTDLIDNELACAVLCDSRVHITETENDGLTVSRSGPFASRTNLVSQMRSTLGSIYALGTTIAQWRRVGR